MRRLSENIWLLTEWITSGHMQSSNHVYGHQKAADDDWLVWHLYLKHTPVHVSNLLRSLPRVLSLTDNLFSSIFGKSSSLLSGWFTGPEGEAGSQRFNGLDVVCPLSARWVVV